MENKYGLGLKMIQDEAHPTLPTLEAACALQGQLAREVERRSDATKPRDRCAGHMPSFLVESR